MKKLIPLLCCLLLLLPCMVEGKEKVIDLKYKPREKVKVKPKKVPSVKIFIEDIRDGRSNPKIIGENKEEKTIQIETADAGGARQFLRGVLKKEFQGNGFSLVESAGAAQTIITGTLVKFWTLEKSRYKSDIQLKISVKNKAGLVAYNKTYAGTGGNFGHSLSEENYQESISNAATSLVDKIFSDASLLRALSEAPAMERGASSSPAGKAVFGPR
ncbi:MAG: YajG family lipoprotein [Thermodesulfobacteriota bacterium]